jgi:hypothetical protein
MQCILYQNLFLEGFSYVLEIDMHFICTPMLTKFYSCKKWVLQTFKSCLVKINYLCHFISNLAGRVEPLLPLVQLKHEEEFNWGAE